MGTNDGNVQVSRDSGNTWKNVAEKVPGVAKETHVSRVEASHFDPGSYLVKVLAGDKVIGQKTVVVEADTTFMQR